MPILVSESAKMDHYTTLLTLSLPAQMVKLPLDRAEAARIFALDAAYDYENLPRKRLVRSL